MFIVTLSSYFGSCVEASQPQEIWGPFETKKEATTLEKNVNKWIKDSDWGERLAQTFEIGNMNIPHSADDLAEILDIEDELIED
jgi:hypothetical protein